MKVFIKNRQRPFVRTFNFGKMKIPKCFCGITRGFNHEFKCWSCACFPWQHSSDEDDNVSLDSEAEEARRKYDEFQERIRLLNEEEDRRIQEDMERKYTVTLSIIEDGEIKSALNETRLERQAAFEEDRRKQKRKKLKSKAKLDRNRRSQIVFREVSYALNAYEHHKAKQDYEFEQVSFYMSTIFEDAEWNTNRFLNAGISLDQLDIQSYADYIKMKEES